MYHGIYVNHQIYVTGAVSFCSVPNAVQEAPQFSLFGMPPKQSSRKTRSKPGKFVHVISRCLVSDFKFWKRTLAVECLRVSCCYQQTRHGRRRRARGRLSALLATRKRIQNGNGKNSLMMTPKMDLKQKKMTVVIGPIVTVVIAPIVTAPIMTVVIAPPRKTRTKAASLAIGGQTLRRSTPT